MAEIVARDEAGILVSLRVAVKAVEISLGEMKRIAGVLVTGHRRTWLGAIVEICIRATL